MEEKKKLAVAFSPHITAPGTVTTIMLDVIIALIPACIAAVYYFGWGSLLTIVVSMAAAVGGEALLQLILKKPITVGDLSAALTGLLIALNMPANVPLYIPVVGSLFAILIVKQCFGGLGYNFVNPALSARAMLMVAWPVAMTTYLAPHAVDGVSSATPLAGEGSVELLDLFLGNVGGSIGETCKVALIIGGIYLIIRKVISWRIPVIYIATVALMTLILNGAAAVPYALLSGGLMLGAFFMATDYVTSPSNPWGQVVFALGCGILTCVIRNYGGYAEGVCFSILLMNVATPLIERATKRRIYGEVKSK